MKGSTSMHGSASDRLQATDTTMLTSQSQPGLHRAQARATPSDSSLDQSLLRSAGSSIF